MIRLRETVRQSRYAESLIAACFVLVVAFLTPAQAFRKSAQSVQEQPPSPPNSATLQGLVRDSYGHPVAAATVFLQQEIGAETLTTHTDAKGAYKFPSVREGVYTLRAEMAGYDAVTFGPCALGPKDATEIDLTLRSTANSLPQSSPDGRSGREQPQFFDEPEFTVAGVTEAMNPGGHGSDTILRTTEALAKETASLSASNKELANSRTAAPAFSFSTAAEGSLREAAEHDPDNFDANRSLGKLLFDNGNAREALPYLERASRLNPSDYENAYQLALAYADTGQYEHARTAGLALLGRQNTDGKEQANVHHLLGDTNEKLGNPLEALREYQRAAELDPSEPNLFDWGTDLLVHRAYEPAVEVFTKGNRLYPHSARMLTGLGVAAYARGAYEEAAQRLCEASDLNPDDPNPYLFLGKMQSVKITQSECAIERLGRFAKLQSNNASANYYYALTLWNRHEASGSVENLEQVKSLLERAVNLDPKFGAADLQLGILYSEHADYPRAIAAYEAAINANPEMEEAHYRLAQAYNRIGEKAKAQAELQLYQHLSKKKSEEAEHERREIQQFVYTLRGNPTASTPP